MFGSIVDLVVGDSRKPERSARAPDVPMLSHFLGYRSFDEEKRIFHQVRSKGFILELAPLVGANDRVSEIIGTIFSDILQPGTRFSVTNFSSPRVAEMLQAWALPRFTASGVFRTLARHRLDKLLGGAWSTLASDGPFFVRNFRVVMSVGIGQGSSLTNDDLVTMRDGIISALESINVPVRQFAPIDLIRLFDEILAPSNGAGDEVPDYNRFDPINEQCVRRDLVTHVEKDRLVLHAQSLRPTGAVASGVPELKDFVPEMARNETRLNDTERGLIDQAVNLVWEEHGRDGTVDHVIAALGQAQHPCAYDLATSLLPFAAKGTFGRFFLGDANLDLSADLTVFELSDLATREELRGVVLTSIMFIASQVMRRMDRATPKPLIIDEAWQMLKGGAMADFVETYSRTCRKYGGALITATQSIHDYYKSEGSRAALENSDWFLILQQKGETISDFRNSDRFEMDNLTEALLRSLKRNGTDYSDIFIRGPDTESIGRLVLDRYSAALYSSSPDVFARIEAYIERGLPMHDAIEAVAFPEGYQQAEAAE